MRFLILVGFEVAASNPEEAERLLEEQIDSGIDDAVVQGYNMRQPKIMDDGASNRTPLFGDVA